MHSLPYYMCVCMCVCVCVCACVRVCVCVCVRAPILPLLDHALGLRVFHANTHTHTTWRRDVWCVALLVSAILGQHTALSLLWPWTWFLSLYLYKEAGLQLHSTSIYKMYNYHGNPQYTGYHHTLIAYGRWSLGEPVNIIMSNWTTTTTVVESEYLSFFLCVCVCVHVCALSGGTSEQVLPRLLK